MLCSGTLNTFNREEQYIRKLPPSKLIDFYQLPMSARVLLLYELSDGDAFGGNHFYYVNTCSEIF